MNPNAGGNRVRGVYLDKEQVETLDEDERCSRFSGSGGARQGRCSPRPDNVRVSASWECYVAMITTFLECETALSRAGGLVSGGNFDADGSKVINCYLAVTVATVASSLRYQFSPKMMTITTAQWKKRKSNELRVLWPQAPRAAPALAESPASTRATAKNSGKSKAVGGAEGTGGKPPPIPAVDVFQVKGNFMSMHVLEASSSGRSGGNNGQRGRNNETVFCVHRGNCAIVADVVTVVVVATAINFLSATGRQASASATRGETSGQAR